MTDFSQLYKKIGYVFSDESLLQLALTHRSVHGQNNNERLEFLGDSIFGFVIAEALFGAFDAAREGQLTRLRAQLVSGSSLAIVARELGLGHYVRLGPGELKSGGHRRDSILADTLEAILGAIYLDGGIESCREVVLNWFNSRLKDMSLTTPKDAKTRLQEWLQSRQMRLPEYRLISTTGPAHDQTFYVSCAISEMALMGQGEGGSRRQAEQLAAQAILDQLTPQ